MVVKAAVKEGTKDETSTTASYGWVEEACIYVG